MIALAYYYGDIIQIALAAMTILLAIVSVNAYRKRPEARYLLLMVAFISLCSISVSTMAAELFVVGEAPAMIPFVEQYLIPSLELLMVISFLVAIAWSPKVRKHIFLIFLAAVITIGLAASTAYLSGPAVSNSNIGVQSASSLPTDCVKHAAGFLIVVSSLGYNDSIAHGAPIKSWPVLDVGKGSNVTITVCNSYSQPVGFQVAHYVENQTQVVLPNHALTLDFIADQTGSFSIYCAVFSPIHIYLQGGEVNVV